MADAAPLDIELQVEKKAKPPWESRLTVVPTEWYTTPAPPRRWLLRDSRRDNEGVFPLGKVGLAVAEGGAGKTMVVTQLTLAVAAGLRWLGAFDVPHPGRVLLVLGEEDAEESHRRIYRAGQQAGQVPPEGNVVVLPLAGITCPLVVDGEDAPFLVWLRDYVKRNGPFSLVVLDPVSRFADEDTEKDNAAATRFITALESLVEPAGGAAVLASHHSNQNSRRDGAKMDVTSARGVSAITDGSRWVCTLQVDRFTRDDKVESVVTLSMAKSNYSMFASPVTLRYGEGGVLEPHDDDSLRDVERARDEADPKTQKRRRNEKEKSDKDSEIDAAVVEAVKATPGIGATDLRSRVKAIAKCGADAADTGIARVLHRNVIRRTEGRPKGHYLVAEASAQQPPAPTVTKPTPTSSASNSRDIIDEIRLSLG